MADFTPYGGVERNWGFWGDLWSKGGAPTVDTWNANPSYTARYPTPVRESYAQFPEYERFSKDYGALEEQLYGGLAGRITEQKDLARAQFLARQRSLGVGDSPITDTVWGERIAPTYDQRYVDAASSAAQLRSNLEMTDIGQYNTAMSQRTAQENQWMTEFINNAMNRDYQGWAANTAAGFQNRAMSAASSMAQAGADSSLWGAIMKAVGQMGGQALSSMGSGSGGGGMSDVWGAGSAGGDLGSTAGSGAGSAASNMDFGGLF